MGVSEYKIKSVLQDGVEVFVIIETALYDKDKSIYTDSSCWGAERNSPKMIIKNISVKRNDDPCWVSFSSYSDLMNPKNAKVYVSDLGFQIVIDGGVSSTHYFAVLSFDNECYLTKRRVYSPAFPDEVWEETQYSYIRRKDM
jgi:hypothetical protein